MHKSSKILIGDKVKLNPKPNHYIDYVRGLKGTIVSLDGDRVNVDLELMGKVNLLLEDVELLEK
jgi:hypothetical protein